MNEIVFGRDAATSKLRITIDGKPITDSNLAKTPKSVSKDHAKLLICDDGKLILKNLNIENDTFVNGRSIETKVIRNGDQIELGSDHYGISWSLISKLTPKTADIRPLEEVWKTYNSDLMEMQIKQGRFGVIKSVSGIVMAIAGCVGVFLGRDNYVYLFIMLIIITFAIVCFVISYMQSSKIPQKREQLKEEAKKKYKCPACDNLLVLQDYDNLKQQKKCPHCGAIFKK